MINPVKKLRSPARHFVEFSGKLYVMLEDGSIWEWDGAESWLLIAESISALVAEGIKRTGGKE